MPTRPSLRRSPCFTGPCSELSAAAPYSTSVTFTSQAAIDAGIPARLGLRKRAVAVKNCRTIAKRDMILNDATPRLEVDPETYEVRADGELLTCEPVSELPLAQRYFLF